ncbi:putative ribonuclease H-like domain-containing protein [Tanacetum coccineum]
MMAWRGKMYTNYVVPTGRIVVPTGRYVVPAGKGLTILRNVIEDVLQSFIVDTKPEQQLAYEDFEQIEKIDLEEMDLKCVFKEDTLPMNAGAKGGKTCRDIPHQDSGDRKEGRRLIQRSHNASDAGEFALICVTSVVQGYKKLQLRTWKNKREFFRKNQLTLEDKIRVLSIELENTTNLLKHFERINAIVETAKKELQTKLDNQYVSTSESEAEIESNLGHLSKNPLLFQDLYLFALVKSTSCTLRTSKVFIPTARPNQVPVGRPKSVSTGVPVSTSKQNRPPLVHVGRRNSFSVTSGWRQIYYNQMQYVAKMGRTAVKALAGCSWKTQRKVRTVGVLGKGQSKTPTLDFENVYYVKNSKHVNLFSSSQICDKKKEFSSQTLDYLVEQKVKAIRCDNGTEFKNAEIIKLCGSKGIKKDYSNARTPATKWVSGEKNRTLIKAARTIWLTLITYYGFGLKHFKNRGIQIIFSICLLPGLYSLSIDLRVRFFMVDMIRKYSHSPKGIVDSTTSQRRSTRGTIVKDSLSKKHKSRDHPVKVYGMTSFLDTTKEGLVWMNLRPDEGSNCEMIAMGELTSSPITATTSNLEAVKKIFKYLKGQPRESHFVLVAYSDSAYAGANKDRKSTTGGCQFLGRRLISWQSRTTIVLPLPLNEYVCTANYCGQRVDSPVSSVLHDHWFYFEPKFHTGKFQVFPSWCNQSFLLVVFIFPTVTTSYWGSCTTVPQIIPEPIPEPMPETDQPQDHLTAPPRQQTSDPIAPVFGAMGHRSTQSSPAGHTSGGAEDPITLTALSSVVSTLVQKVNSWKLSSRHTRSYFKDCGGKVWVKQDKAME